MGMAHELLPATAGTVPGQTVPPVGLEPTTKEL